MPEPTSSTAAAVRQRATDTNLSDDEQRWGCNGNRAR